MKKRGRRSNPKRTMTSLMMVATFSPPSVLSSFQHFDTLRSRELIEINASLRDRIALRRRCSSAKPEKFHGARNEIMDPYEIKMLENQERVGLQKYVVVD